MQATASVSLCQHVFFKTQGFAFRFHPEPAYSHIQSFGIFVSSRHPQTQEPMVLVRKVANEYYGYKWSLAKGRPDESDFNRFFTAHRETYEEVGIKLHSRDFLADTKDLNPHTGQPYHSRFYFAEIGYHQVNLRFSSNETDEVRWVSISEALQLLNIQSDRMVVQAFIGLLQAHGYEFH